MSTHYLPGILRGSSHTVFTALPALITPILHMGKLRHKKLLQLGSNRAEDQAQVALFQPPTLITQPSFFFFFFFFLKATPAAYVSSQPRD